MRSDIEVDENDYISFSLPELPFKQNHHTKIYHKAYFSFSYSYRNDQGKYAEVISDISTDDWVSIIKEFGSKYEWRISREGIIRYIRFERDRVFFNLPTSFKFFTKFFKNKGFSIKETASGKLGKEVLKNIGGIYGINIFSTENSIKIIELFQGGKIVHLDTLVGNIKRLNPFPEFKNNHSGLIDLLLENQIIEFGVQIQCEVCEQRSFYLINDLADNLKCSVCRNTFNFPKSNPKKSLQYVYRGVGPFSRNNKVDGLLSVLLTIRLFKLSIIDGFDRGLSFLFDFEIKRKDKLFEIDLVIMADGKQNKSNTKAFICECKTFKHIERKDIERLKYVGQQIPNMILVIATLNKEFTIEEKALLIELTEFFRTKNGVTSNPILLLTGDELIPNRRHFPLKKYEDKIAGHQYVDYVNTLADLTCEEHLNLKTCDELSSEAWVEMQKKKKAVQKKVRTTS